MPIFINEPASRPDLAPNALFLHRCCTLYKLTMADRSQICGKHDCFEIPTMDDWIDDRETEASSMNMTLSANALASNGELARSLL